jgi:uncharacterized membrane protein
VYYHHNYSFFAGLFVILAAVVVLILFGVIGVAFSDVGFSPLLVVLILVATLFGSFINIPIAKLKSSVPIVREEYVNFFGLTYRIPHVHYGVAVTTLAINVGGALIPTAVSIYLLAKAPAITISYSLIGIMIVASVTHLIARPVKGVGIVTPAFIPPFAASLVAIVLAPSSPLVAAYVSGVMGTLIGADLLNLNRISNLGAPIASIGGAGTFDGVFLSGIIAVILTAL